MPRRPTCDGGGVVTWTKIDDDLPDHMIELSDSAFRLHLAATVYSNRVGSDGRIPKRRLSLVPVPPRTRRPAIVKELVTAGFWYDGGDAWELTDFLEDQPSAEEVACRKAYDAIRQRLRFARASGASHEMVQVLKVEETESLRALNDARERRRAGTSHVSHGVSHSAPFRSVSGPSRSDTRERGRDLPSAPLVGAPAVEMCGECRSPLRTDPDGCQSPLHASTWGASASALGIAAIKATAG